MVVLGYVHGYATSEINQYQIEEMTNGVWKQARISKRIQEHGNNENSVLGSGRVR